MQEKLFRVYNLDTNTIIQSEIGSKNVHYYIDEGDAITEREGTAIVEYAGFKDETDNKVYEHDLVEWIMPVIANGKLIGEEYIVGAIVKTNAEWAILTRDGIARFITPDDVKKIRVIGNLYENADLETVKNIMTYLEAL